DHHLPAERIDLMRFAVAEVALEPDQVPAAGEPLGIGAPVDHADLVRTGLVVTHLCHLVLLKVVSPPWGSGARVAGPQPALSGDDHHSDPRHSRGTELFRLKGIRWAGTRREAGAAAPDRRRRAARDRDAVGLVRAQRRHRGRIDETVDDLADLESGEPRDSPPRGEADRFSPSRRGPASG